MPTLREAEAARNTSDVDVDQQLLGESAGGNSLPEIPLPDVPLPDVPFPDIPLPDVHLCGVCLHGSVCEECSSPRVAEKAMVVGFGIGSGSCLVRFICSNQYISSIDYYTQREGFELLRGLFIDGCWIGCISFIV